jgi:hypothetical protein
VARRGAGKSPLKKYIVQLTSTEQSDLTDLASATEAQADARRINRALVLLAAYDGETDEEIALKVGVSFGSVGRLRRRFVEEGLEAALSERPRPPNKLFEETHQEASLAPQSSSEARPDEWMWRFRPQTHSVPAEEQALQPIGRSFLPASIVRVVQPFVGLLYVIGLLLEFFLLFHFVPFAIEGSRTVAVGVSSIVLIFLGMAAWRISCSGGQASTARPLPRTTGSGLQRQVIVSTLRRGWLAAGRNVTLLARRRT